MGNSVDTYLSKKKYLFSDYAQRTWSLVHQSRVVRTEGIGETCLSLSELENKDVLSFLEKEKEHKLCGKVFKDNGYLWAIKESQNIKDHITDAKNLDDISDSDFSKCAFYLTNENMAWKWKDNDRFYFAVNNRRPTNAILDSKINLQKLMAPGFEKVKNLFRKLYEKNLVCAYQRFVNLEFSKFGTIQESFMYYYSDYCPWDQLPDEVIIEYEETITIRNLLYEALKPTETELRRDSYITNLLQDDQPCTDTGASAPDTGASAPDTVASAPKEEEVEGATS